MKKILLTLLTVVCAVSSWGYRATINFYDADKLSSTSGTNLTAENYADFVTVPTGQTNTNVVTGVTCTGTVRFGMNGGLTVGTGSANDNAVTFTLGSNVVVTKCTVWATVYDSGKWKLNDNNADSGSAGAKGTELGKVTSPYVWDNINATTLAFTKCTTDSKEGQCKRMTILKIEIEYTVDGSAGASVSVTGVSLNKTTASLNEGESTTLTATIAPNDATNQNVTWTSNNTSVATVDNGVVTAISAGTATITVETQDGNFTANCVVTVIAPIIPDMTKLCTLVFKESGTSSDSSTKYSSTPLSDMFSEGDTFVSSVSQNSNVYPARTGRGAKFGSSSSTGSLTFNLADGKKAIGVVINAAGYADGEVNAIKVNNISKTPKNYASQGFNELTYIFDEATSTITIATATKRAYVKSIDIMVESESADISVSAAGYTTYYNSAKAFTLPTGMTASVWSDGLVEMYEEGEVVPEGEPVVLKADEGNYKLEFTTSGDPTFKDIDMNDLEGTDVKTALTADANSYFYGLSLNAAGETNSVGFYWMVENGAAFTNGAHKAYLKLPKTQGAKSAFRFNNTTGIKTVNTEATVNKAVKRIMNGQLIIEKAGKMYNAAGVEVNP